MRRQPPISPHLPAALLLAAALAFLLAPQAGAAQDPPAAAAPTASDACLKCHAPIQTALKRKLKHAAVDMGCDSCHINHRDKQAAQTKTEHYLTGKQSELCAGCHDYKDKAIAAAHKGQPFETAECSGCHDPHASDRPKLIAAQAHGPFDARQCDSCHKAPKDGKIALTAASTSELCFTCHADLQERYTKAKSKHTLLSSDINTCTDCHDPHATNQARALKRPVTTLCTTCHSGLTEEKKFVHEPVKGSCAICHDAHGSEHSKNLHAPVETLCLECHNTKTAPRLFDGKETTLFSGKVTLPPQSYSEIKTIEITKGRFGHPTGNHPVFADAKDGKPGFNCLTCHLPHAANGSLQLLVTEEPTTMTLCNKCHK
ncbi:MAG: cytochrome c3 family protein [Acidobacteria bacterium]|nr:cytochrome c3 family protein [Acidobacteriota bacterium]